jgi:hypothetical protein
MKIATRLLKLRTAGTDVGVQIDIFAPKPDGDVWKCEYEINWPDDKWVSHAGGADSAQALVLALQKIGVEIYFSEYHTSGRLYWDEPGKGYGFPVPASARDALIGDDLKFN